MTKQWYEIVNSIGLPMKHLWHCKKRETILDEEETKIVELEVKRMKETTRLTYFISSFYVH